MKKETKLGLAVTKSEDFHEWYRLLVLEAELISTYSVSGTTFMHNLHRNMQIVREYVTARRPSMLEQF